MNESEQWWNTPAHQPDPDRARVAELSTMDLETPAFVYDEKVIAEDVATARDALAPTGAKLLFAVKAFSFEDGLAVMAPLVDGFHTSSLFEARLARHVIGDGIVHTTTPGLRPSDAGDIFELSDRISFNSVSQWQRFADAAVGRTSPGLRVNPRLSFVADERLDPCARNSKLGVPIDQLAARVRTSPQVLEGIEGLLVHSNCESIEFDDLLRLVEHLVDQLDPMLRRLKWVNLGGGYLFRDARDHTPLRKAVSLLRDTYGVEVLVEPGTSLIYRAGSLVTTVVDLIEGPGRDIAVLDVPITHVPEVLEFPFLPDVAATDGANRYLLAGASCLVSDQFGLHSFPEPLRVGSRVVISDVGAYSLVEASWFNGISLPTVYSRAPDGSVTLRRRYRYDDFLTINGGSHARH
ncbi:MAG: hypothetical protein M0Z62_04155 [Actinomycetota bacterium]|nr:hypothetical protein [Actinomycetota bacterium]